MSLDAWVCVNVMPFLNMLGFVFVPGLCCVFCESISDLSSCMSIYVTKRKVEQLQFGPLTLLNYSNRHGSKHMPMALNSNIYHTEINTLLFILNLKGC